MVQWWLKTVVCQRIVPLVREMSYTNHPHVRELASLRNILSVTWHGCKSSIRELAYPWKVQLPLYLVLLAVHSLQRTKTWMAFCRRYYYFWQGGLFSLSLVCLLVSRSMQKQCNLLQNLMERQHISYWKKTSDFDGNPGHIMVGLEDRVRVMDRWLTSHTMDQ